MPCSIMLPVQSGKVLSQRRQKDTIYYGRSVLENKKIRPRHP